MDWLSRLEVGSTAAEGQLHGLSPEGQELFSGAEPPPPEGLLVPFLVVVAQATACKSFIQDTGMAWTGPLGTVVHIAGRGVSHGAGGLGRTGSTPFLFLEFPKGQDARAMVPNCLHLGVTKAETARGPMDISPQIPQAWSHLDV